MATVERRPARVSVLQWRDFADMFRGAHRQGEHCAMVGQTGSGKSVLGLELCKIIARRKGKDGRPSRVVILSVKPRDDTISALGWPIIKKWPPSYGQEHCIVWPRKGTPSTRAETQRAVFNPLLDTIYHEGGQTLYIDEAAYFEEPLPKGLGLAATMEQYWTTARGLKLSLIAGTQRPRHVTRSMWSEPSWLFVFPPDDEDDLRRVAEISGVKAQLVEIVPHLGGHEFLCVRRQRDMGGQKELYISKVHT
jgi:hypothetical protein